jgi:hypothetical protein
VNQHHFPIQNQRFLNYCSSTTIEHVNVKIRIYVIYVNSNFSPLIIDNSPLESLVNLKQYCFPIRIGPTGRKYQCAIHITNILFNIDLHLIAC